MDTSPPSTTWDDAKKLAWEVWEVYKSWGRWIYHKYRPYNPYMTWQNIGMASVTLLAIIIGFVYLFRQRERRKKLEEERERRLSFSADDLFIKKQHLRRVRDPEDDEIRRAADKRREENGSGDEPRMEELDDSSADELDQYAEKEKPVLTKDGRDPFDLAMHIPSELKKIQNKITTRELEKRLTADQREEESRMRRQQLEQIFKLMQDQKDKFGEQNSSDIEEQMRMYSL